MFDIHCHHCDTRYLLSLSQLDSLHNTSEGPIGYATCPKGHHLVRRFRTRSRPGPGTRAIAA